MFFSPSYIDPQKQGGRRSGNLSDEEMLTVTIERQAGKHLGIRLSGNIEQKPGIFIADIQEGSVVSLDGRLQKYDRILFINGQDVREVELSQASALIQVKYCFFVFSFKRSVHMLFFQQLFYLMTFNQVAFFPIAFLSTLKYLINEYTHLTIQCLAPSSCQS